MDVSAVKSIECNSFNDLMTHAMLKSIMNILKLDGMRVQDEVSR
jgi:hypothetical protein